jgi:hypothetical protein
MNRPKKCPRCNSTKITICGFKFSCKKCGFINDYEFHLKNFNPKVVKKI